MRNGVINPDANLGLAGYAVFPAIAIFKAHIEQTHRRLVAQRRAILLRRLPNEPRHLQAAASLAVGGQQRHATANGHVIQRVERAATVGNARRFRIDRANRLVPHVEQAQQPLLTPLHPRSIHGVVYVHLARQRHTRRLAKVRYAMHAVANPFAVPAVMEEPIRVVTAHDLLVHGGHELKVVRAIGAGQPHAGH